MASIFITGVNYHEIKLHSNANFSKTEVERERKVDARLDKRKTKVIMRQEKKHLLKRDRWNKMVIRKKTV